MEAAAENDPTPGASVEPEESGRGFRASEEALMFMSSIEPAELQKCVFPDSLVIVSESGRDLGEFTLTVEFSYRNHKPCLLLHAQSHGAIDGCPCGTTVTTYLTSELEVLEEDFHEYVKLTGHSMDKRRHMLQHDGQMVINKVASVGEEVTEESVSYPVSVLRGLVTEGSSLLLMRLFALRKKVPKHMTCLSLDQQLHIVPTSFSELGVKQLEVQGEMKEVFGVERIVDTVEDSPTTWQCHFLDNGHLISRVQLGSPSSMRLPQLPSNSETGLEKIPLVWEEDLQMHSKFLDRKEELKEDHTSYLRQHPEIRTLISDFLQFLLLRKPDDVIQFAKEYFRPFSTGYPKET
ncbi:ciliogenesis-associated TTC17-interacting protein-like [Pholidichthys leucotaenia]